MKRILLIGLLVLPFQRTLFSQNAEQDLQNAVQIYNALQEYITPLNSPSDITPDVLNSVKKRVKDGISLLDQVINNGTAEQIKTARYFKINFKYKQGFVLGTKGDETASFRELDNIRTEFESYSDAAKFPLRYKFNEKNYVIKYEDFTPTLSQFYTSIAELAGNLNKPELQYEYAKKTYNFPNINKWYKYIAVTQIIDYLTDKKRYDTELAQYALQQIKIYINDLNETEHETLKRINFPTPLSSGNFIKSVLDQKPDFVNSESICGEAAILLEKTENRNDLIIVQFYETAVKGDKYLNEALNFARNRREGNNIVSPFPTNSTRFKALGVAVLDKNVTKVSNTNCDDLQKIADDYKGFGEETKSQALMTRFNNCTKEKAAAAERRAQLEKKENERRERERRKANREAHIYVGAYLLPLLSKPIDLGGVVNFGAKNFLVELSYLKITEKKESYFDLAVRDVKDVQEHKWNGYFAHVALKFANRKSSSRKGKIYTGPLFGYNQRTLVSFQSQVTNTTTNKVTNELFAPTSKQYIGMLNMGLLGLSGIGFDMYVGIGASYTQFDGGNSTVWNKDNYKIEDRMLANRKPTYYSFMMRMGITLGFGK